MFSCFLLLFSRWLVIPVVASVFTLLHADATCCRRRRRFGWFSRRRVQGRSLNVRARDAMMIRFAFIPVYSGLLGSRSIFALFINGYVRVTLGLLP